MSPEQHAAARKHVVEMIERTSIELDPWPHCYVTGVFPLDYYEEILRCLPAPPKMELMNPKQPHRHLYWLQKKTGEVPIVPEFWDALRDDLFDYLWMALEDKLGVIGSTTGAEIVHDIPGYELGPHTDTPDKVITGLFYLPIDVSGAAQGTVLYRGEQADPAGKLRKGWKFDVVRTMPYVPNSALFFARTDWSYHGVNRSPIERWTLAFDVFR